MNREGDTEAAFAWNARSGKGIVEAENKASSGPRAGGAVRLRGTMLCEPCGHLEKLTRPGVRKSLIHRGGLCAQILNDGEIRVGDSIYT